MTEEATEKPTQLKRERSPSFPYLDLETSIEHLAKVYSAAKMNAVRPSDVADSWGMSTKSGSMMRYVAALTQFGLLEASGTGDQRRFKVSATGRRILEDDRPGVKGDLQSTAALLPKLIRGLYLGEGGMPEWGGDRPSDSIAESALMFDMNFGQEAARRFLSVYDATILHVIDERKDSTDDTEGLDNSQPIELEPTPRQQSEIGEQMDTQQANAISPPAPVVSAELNRIDAEIKGDTVLVTALLDRDGLKKLAKKIAALSDFMDDE